MFQKLSEMLYSPTMFQLSSIFTADFTAGFAAFIPEKITYAKSLGRNPVTFFARKLKMHFKLLLVNAGNRNVM